MIDDAGVHPENVRRVILCSGKVYYDLLKKRQEVGKIAEVALVRLEQLYPWPAERLAAILGRYRSPDGSGSGSRRSRRTWGRWTFVAPRLRDLLGEDILYVGRDASASPATGSHAVHEREQAELVEAAIGADVPHLV